jgi:hypothetical protein
MPYSIKRRIKGKKKPSFKNLTKPMKKALKKSTPLKSRSNRGLQMTLEDQLNALVLFHLEEHASAQHLLQVLKEDDFARKHIAPKKGIEKSSFSEAMNTRGLKQIIEVFEALVEEAQTVLPKEYKELGDLTLIDGSLIDATLSMYWADYRDGAKKAKAHLGFDLNHGIPRKIFLTDGKGDERPFVSKIISPGQTGVMDRYYQCHKNFDQWQKEQRHFICRIKAKTIKEVIRHNEIDADSIVFYDAIVLLGTSGLNQTEKELRVVGYKVDNKNYWIATDRYDLTAEQIALAYKLRWNIESFFAWWKQHLKVYHLIARSKHGLMVQILGGLITYILLAIYCHNEFGEKVSIKRVRELRINIINETREMESAYRSRRKRYKKRRRSHFPNSSYANT